MDTSPPAASSTSASDAPYDAPPPLKAKASSPCSGAAASSSPPRDARSFATSSDADETARTGEAVCEAGFACVGGIKTSCDDGFSNPGSSKCEFCGPGKYMHEAEDSTKDCVGCQAGKYSETGSNSIEGCLTCGIGEYSSAASGFCSTVKAGEEVSKSEASAPTQTFARVKTITHVRTHRS